MKSKNSKKDIGIAKKVFPDIWNLKDSYEIPEELRPALVAFKSTVTVSDDAIADLAKRIACGAFFDVDVSGNHLSEQKPSPR